MKHIAHEVLAKREPLQIKNQQQLLEMLLFSWVVIQFSQHEGEWCDTRPYEELLQLAAQFPKVIKVLESTPVSRDLKRHMT